MFRQLANIPGYGLSQHQGRAQPVVDSVGTDPTTYDTTIQTAPGILCPSLSTNTYFIDRVDLIVNKGKAGGLTPAQMATALTNVAGTLP